MTLVAIILFIVGGTEATWKTTSGGQPDVECVLIVVAKMENQ